VKAQRNEGWKGDCAFGLVHIFLGFGGLGISACREVLRGNSFCAFFPGLYFVLLFVPSFTFFHLSSFSRIVPFYAYDNLGLGGGGFVL